MIRIAENLRRNTGEPLLPMIDVVFFLVVFFMLTSRMSEPVPLAVVPPLAETEIAVGDLSLFMDSSGMVATSTVLSSEADVLTALNDDRARFCTTTDCAAASPVLLLHADAKAPAKRVAHLIAELGRIGIRDIRIVTGKP